MNPASTMARRALFSLGLAAGLILVLTLLGLPTLGVDADQARLCRLILPAINADGVALEVQRVSPEEAPFSIRLDYLAGGLPRIARCGFQGSALDPSRSELAVFADDDDVFTPIRLHILKRFWLGKEQTAASLDPGPGKSVTPMVFASRPLTYLIQQLANGLAPTAILALIAACYALIYGLIGRINLAFGDIAIIGGLGAVTGAGMASAIGIESLALAFLYAGVVAVAITLLHGAVIERAVIAPLAFGRGQTLLIATVALSIVIQEYLRLSAGPGMHWLPPVLTDPVAIASDGDFVATVTVMQVTVGCLGGLMALGLMGFLAASRFGMCWRAVADDPTMAALMGVSPRRVLSQSFLLACGLAGIAGFITTMQYGGASPSGGTVLGLKALAAAVVGGIGSVGGAMLGGLAIGLFEALWTAYLPIEQVDLAVLAVLVLVLVLRPGGLFGFADERPRQV